MDRYIQNFDKFFDNKTTILMRTIRIFEINTYRANCEFSIFQK